MVALLLVMTDSFLAGIKTNQLGILGDVTDQTLGGLVQCAYPYQPPYPTYIRGNLPYNTVYFMWQSCGVSRGKAKFSTFFTTCLFIYFFQFSYSSVIFFLRPPTIPGLTKVSPFYHERTRRGNQTIATLSCCYLTTVR